MIPNKKVSAGRVLILPRGEYSADTTYQMLDLVNYNGYAWLCKKTAKGIVPSALNSTYWHDLLDIKRIVEDNIADTVADDVGDILELRFRDMLSEAKYVTDLNADYTEATFVRWDAETENTPYKASLTECTEGFALVFGSSADNHTIISWTKTGENFTHSITGGAVIGWDAYLSKSGGTMTGPLSFAEGKASVSGDANGTFLQATKDADNYRKLVVENPSSGELSESAKIVSKEEGAEKKHNLFGEHNLDKMFEVYGFARIYNGTFIGDGKSKRTFTLPHKPKLICWNGDFTCPYGSLWLHVAISYAIEEVRVDCDDTNITIEADFAGHFGNKENETIYYSIIY